MQIDDSYKEMLHNYPPPVLIEIAREEWDKSEIVHASEIDPMRNTKSLYWRLTGIGKEQVERIPQHIVQQMNAISGWGNAYAQVGLLGPGASAHDLNAPGWLQGQLRNYSTPEGK